MAASSEAQRHLMIRDACKEPHSIQDLADMWGASYWTVRRDVINLVTQGALKEMPYRSDKKKVYISAADNDAAGRLVYRGSSKDWTLSEMMEHAEYSGTAAFRVISRTLAHLYMRSYGTLSGQDHLKGNVSLVETKKQMRVMLSFLKQWVSWLEQMLLTDDLWKEDNERLVDQFGPVDTGVAQTWAVEYNDQTQPYRPRTGNA